MKTNHRICRFALGLITCASVLHNARASTVYESATLGRTGYYANSGFSIDANQYLGWRFHLDEPFQVHAIGGNIHGSGTFFGAIVPVSSLSAFPSGRPFDATTISISTFGGPGDARDISIPLSTFLVPGDYALIFGSGQFGTVGNGTMSFFNPDLPWGSPYLSWRVGSWHEFDAAHLFAPPTPSGIRFVVYGDVAAVAPPTITCSAPLTLECANGVATGTVVAHVQDSSGKTVDVVWYVDGTPAQTNNIPSGGTIMATNVTFTADFGFGEHTVVASASNGQTMSATSSTTVTVSDTLPPDVFSISATPDLLWPPNHRMIPVSVIVSVTDNCELSPVAHIIGVTSNEPQNPRAPDWEITGPLSVSLKAERLGGKGKRIYTIVVECEDSSGNVANTSVDVVVPHDHR